jgi:hypothetical protein
LLVSELFPLACGILVGSVLGAVAPAVRLWLAILLSILLGFAATMISGEFRIGWEYLLIDIPLVGIATALAYLLLAAIGRRARKLSG